MQMPADISSPTTSGCTVTVIVAIVTAGVPSPISAAPMARVARPVCEGVQRAFRSQPAPQVVHVIWASESPQLSPSCNFPDETMNTV
eukprot:scaffold247491_cov48-Tisochrysis_lutea.AAC.2